MNPAQSQQQQHSSPLPQPRTHRQEETQRGEEEEEKGRDGEEKQRGKNVKWKLKVKAAKIISHMSVWFFYSTEFYIAVFFQFWTQKEETLTKGCTKKKVLSTRQFVQRHFWHIYIGLIIWKPI